MKCQNLWWIGLKKKCYNEVVPTDGNDSEEAVLKTIIDDGLQVFFLIKSCFSFVNLDFYVVCCADCCFKFTVSWLHKNYMRV